MFVFSVTRPALSSKYFGTEVGRAAGARLRRVLAARASPAAAPAGDGQVELGHQAVSELTAGGRAAQVVHPGKQDRQLAPAHFDPGARRQVDPTAAVAPQDRPLRLKSAGVAVRAR